MRLRQLRFAHAYVDTNGNVSEALRIAGYKLTSHNNHRRLLDDKEVSTLINQLMDKRYTITKEDYEKTTIDLHNKTTNEHIKKAYWELLGKVKGFIKADTVTNTTIFSTDKRQAMISNRLGLSANRVKDKQ